MTIRKLICGAWNPPVPVKRSWRNPVWRLLLCAGICLGALTGCSDMDALVGLLVTTPEPTPPPVYFAPTPEVMFPPVVSTAARIQARGQLVVGIRYDLEPFSYVNLENGALAGFEIDLARELARRWLGDPNAVAFRQVRSDTAVQAVREGVVDIALAGVVHTQDAESQADFGPAYFRNGQALLVFPDTGVNGLGALGGQTVGVLAWTGSQAVLEASAPVSASVAGEPLSGTMFLPVPYANFFEVIEALRVRQLSVYADQRHRLERAKRMVNGTQIVGQYTAEPWALVYRPNDPFFANVVALTFQDMADDGALSALYAQWFPGDQPPEAVCRECLRGSPTIPPFSQLPPEMSIPQQLAQFDVRARIRERGALAVGYFVDRWPYSSNRDDGTPTGFEVRLVERFAGLWLGNPQAVTFVPITEADALPRLESGELDLLIGNWLPSRALELRADFTIPIYDDGVSLLSTGSAPVQSLGELAGRAVGVVAGSVGATALPALSQGVGLTPVSYPDWNAAVAGLQSGQVAAILGERRPLLAVFYNQAGFYLADARFNTRPVVWVLPQGDSAFADLVNLTLMAYSSVHAELYHVWFDDDPPALQSLPGHPAMSLVIAPAVQ